jgi:hypothetical protein
MLIWKKINVKYTSNYEIGYLGIFKIFEMHWDGMTNRDQENKISLQCMLPGIKNKIGHFKNNEIAKEKANQILLYWLEQTGLKIKE